MSYIFSIGENLYYSRGYAEDSIPARAIESWYDEIDYYDYSNPGNTKYEHYGKPIGHFTQVSIDIREKFFEGGVRKFNFL